MTMVKIVDLVLSLWEVEQELLFARSSTWQCVHLVERKRIEGRA